MIYLIGSPVDCLFDQAKIQPGVTMNQLPLVTTLAKKLNINLVYANLLPPQHTSKNQDNEGTMKIKLIAAIATATALISGTAQASDIRQVEAETEALAHRYMQGICNNNLEDLNAVSSRTVREMNYGMSRAAENCKKTGGVQRIDVSIDPTLFAVYDSIGQVMTGLVIHYKDGATQKAHGYVDNGMITHMEDKLLFSGFSFAD